MRPERYERAALKRSLYPAARVLRPVLMLKRQYFEADRDFILGVGRITRPGQFDYELSNYLHDPANRGFLRQRLKLRTSSTRLRRLVQEAFGEPEGKMAANEISNPKV